MSELKPCPICGQPATRGKGYSGRGYVGCQNFECWLKGAYKEEQWNEYRPVEDELKDEIDDLKRDIDSIVSVG